MDILTSDVPEEPDKRKQGGELSSSHPANRHFNPLETGGEDTAVIGLGVHWDTGYDAFMAMLEEGREMAIKNHSPFVVGSGPETIAILPRGVKSGGGKGMYYPYLVQQAGFLFKIAEHPKPVEETPNVIVEMGSLLLMSCGGLLNAWADVKTSLEGWGGYAFWNKLSRLDLCAELPDANIADFHRLVHLKNQFVTRAVADNAYREHLSCTSVNIGSDQVRLRIYDKARELSKINDVAKQAVLEERRWGGPRKSAVRVEYQLRREVLKELDIGTIADYTLNRAAAGRYLTESWFRLTRRSPDRKNRNTQRVRTHRLWHKVQCAFSDWLGESSDIARRRSAVGADPERLVKQAGGCLMSSVAELSGERNIHSEEFRELAGFLLDWYIAELDEVDFHRKYGEKSGRRIVETPDTVVNPTIYGEVIPWVADNGDTGVFKRANTVGRVGPPDEEPKPEAGDEDDEVSER